MFNILNLDIDSPNDDLYDVILIDGMNVLHRASHAYHLSVDADDGEAILTGASYGFLQIVMGIWAKHARSPSSRLTVCWDGGYRHRISIYPDYKANRRNKKAEDLEPHQIDIPNQGRAIRRILQAAGWSQAVAKGFEADDVLATLAKRWGVDGTKVAICTMDQDLHQCVTDTVHVVSPKWGSSEDIIWTPDAVLEKWGVPPNRVVEIKALAGDSGDNIPGCPGCGKGWAKKFLAGGTTLLELLDAAQEGILSGEHQGKKWRSPSLSKKLSGNRELVLISLELAKVVEDCEVALTQEPQNTDHLRLAFERLEFHSLLSPANLRIFKDMSCPVNS